MLNHKQKSITNEERERFRKSNRRLFNKATLPDNLENVDTYQIAVEKCFVPKDFNEEMPLYFLDLGGTILVLFGQWVFDPHTLSVPISFFDKWDSKNSFFENFSLRCLASGEVFQLAVEGPSLVQSHPLSSIYKFKQLHECQFVRKHGINLTNDLSIAGII